MTGKQRREAKGTRGGGGFAAAEHPESDVSLSSTSRLSIEHTYGRRARQSLEDILDFAAAAAELVSRGKKAYGSDRMLQFAAEAISSRLGEAAARLPSEMIRDHPKVPFRLARDMRNFVSHEYDRVDPEVVWETLEAQIPEFAEQIQRLLRG